MNISDIYSRCANCGYEVTDKSERDFCQNCERAYQLGQEEGKPVEICRVCGYTSQEVRIENGLCSVHTCEKCGAEGYASGDKGDILCEKHGGQ